MEKDIIYIMGLGRSGTTLVDIILGNDNQVFSAGELNRYPLRNGIPPNRYVNEEAAVFWSKFRKLFNKNLSKEKLYAARFEYHTAFFRRRGKTKEYYKYLTTFFKALNLIVDQKVIVDSSKYPLRALHLSKAVPGFKYCIYVKKHPVSVLRSFRKKDIEQPSKHWLSVLIYQMVVHKIAIHVKNRLVKSGIKVLEITFEDVTRNPVEFINEVEIQFNIDLSNVKEKLEANAPLVPGQLFDGNRIRLNKSVNIKPSNEPRNWSFVEKVVYRCNRFWWYD